MKINKDQLISLITIGVIALVLRVTYFILVLDNQNIESLLCSIPDSSTYWKVAQYFFDSHPMGEHWLFQVGPGYGLLLAGLYSFCGESFYSFYIFNIIIGSLAPVGVYLLANELLQNKTVSYMSGLISAVSLTSISLSCNVLTDQPFFTLFTFTIILFVKGLKTDEVKWFIWAGILAGISVYIRAIGMYWFIIFIILPLLIPLHDNVKSKKNLLLKACITSGIMFLMIMSWSVKNYVQYDVLTFGGNGIQAARIRLAAMAVSNNTEGLSYSEINEIWTMEDSIFFNGEKPSIAQAYNRSKNHVVSIVNEHPDWILKEFFANVKENLLGTNIFPRIQIPIYNDFWLTLMSINDEWLALSIVIMSFLGLCLLIYSKQYMAWIILGIVYVYFTLINGFTMWQGSRLQYPIEIAWSILISFFLYKLYQFLKRIFFYRLVHLNVKGGIN